MKTSVLIPSYLRPQKLTRCLEALTKQSVMPDEVVVVHRNTDNDTIEVLEKFTPSLPLLIRSIDLPGVIHAENLAINSASGDLLCFIDDDAYAPIDWIEKIKIHFNKNPQLIALGGPDNIIGDEQYRKTVNTFGKLAWYGKLIGNHHHTGAGVHRVQVLKGVNMIVKKDSMPLLDPLLSSEKYKGNGCHWELDVFLRIQKISPDSEILFDTSLEVQHESQHVDIITKENHRNNARNMTYVYLKNLSFMTNFFHFIYLIFIGHARIPGILKIIHFLVKNENDKFTKIIFAWHGVFEGIKMYYRSVRN